MQKKITIKQKIFHFICYPILSFFALYFIISLLSFLFKGEFLISSEKVITTSATAVGLSIAHWINLFYPPKPRSDSNKHKKSLKEYVKQYVTEGSPFNKFVIMIYSLSIIIVIVVISLSITGHL